MGSINTIQGLLFSNPLLSASGGSAVSSTSSNTNVPATFGAFELMLSQQSNANGSSTDDVSFEAYTVNTNNGNASIMGANGAGGNAPSAFEAMLANINGLDSANSSTGPGSADTNASGTTAPPDWVSSDGLQFVPGPDLSVGFAQNLFKSLDTNSDGLVSKAEWEEGRPTGMSITQADDLFTQMDTTNSGSITESQLHSAVSSGILSTEAKIGPSYHVENIARLG